MVVDPADETDSLALTIDVSDQIANPKELSA